MASPEHLIQCLQRVNATMLALTQCLSEECTLEERKLILQLASESAEQSRRIRRLFYQLYGSDPYSGSRRTYGFYTKSAPHRKTPARGWKVCETRLRVIHADQQKEHPEPGARKVAATVLSPPGAAGTARPAPHPEEASPPAEAPKDEKPDRPLRSGVPPESGFWRR